MSEPRRVQAGPAIAFGVVLLGLAGAALVTIQPRQELDGRLDFWRPGPQVRARLGEIRRRRAAPQTPADETRVLTDAWQAANMALRPIWAGMSSSRNTHRWKPFDRLASTHEVMSSWARSSRTLTA